MLCQNCGENEANIKYTQNINGVKKQMNLCEKCAKKLGLDGFQFSLPIHFSDFLEDFFQTENSDLLPNFITQNNNLCKTCGEEYDNFIKTGLLGCPECYNSFENKIDPILKKLQGNTRHVGRGIENKNQKNRIRINENKDTENVGKAEKTVEEKIEELQEQLKIAIKEERYEDAAKLRDKIKNMKKE